MTASLRESLGRAWDSLAEGWHQLRDRAAQALTHFSPSQGNGALETADEQFMQRASRWGLLAAELSETDDAIIVRLEAPGMEHDDFDVQVLEDTLWVRGEKQLQRQSRQGRYHVMECAYGRFERAIALPAAVDDEHAKASYRRGVLTLTLPKSASARARRIPVKGL